ncbi:MAG TPA: aldehyde dehydrogenase family protein [Paucimonas sp.]|nr:aldehyde dehydrogenase family protein [Paucimonas sp.]
MTRHHLYIGGEWVAAANHRDNINPSDTSDNVGQYDEADASHVAAAVEAAAAAAAAWRRSTPQQRFDALDFIGTEILGRAAEIGALLAREEGKVLPEATGEVTRAGYIFKYFAGEALRIGGQALPSVRPGLDVMTSREALGVVGLITPWNFPIAIPAWKIAPALACGNAVVIKPSELTPACAWVLAEIISRSPLPKGVFNLIMGGGAAGAALIEHPQVAAISFTGSVQTGAHIARTCAGSLKKLQLEMGGKNPLVVLDDADLAIAVECAVNGAFFSTGQRCTASSRLIVTEGIYDRFAAALVERTRGLRVGHALDPQTQIGPVVDERQLQKDMDYIRIGREEGGKLLCGGERVKLEHDGYYLAPALIASDSADARLNREEVFGPVASIIRVRNFEQALAMANDTQFGLSAGICTTSLKHSTQFRCEAQAGMVMVNAPTAGVDYHVPFGGIKGSSFGPREQGPAAMEFYTRVKTHYIAA